MEDRGLMLNVDFDTKDYMGQGSYLLEGQVKVEV
jgi:hypothetical protein